MDFINNDNDNNENKYTPSVDDIISGFYSAKNLVQLLEKLGEMGEAKVENSKEYKIRIQKNVRVSRQGNGREEKKR